MIVCNNVINESLLQVLYVSGLIITVSHISVVPYMYDKNLRNSVFFDKTCILNAQQL